MSASSTAVAVTPPTTLAPETTSLVAPRAERALPELLQMAELFQQSGLFKDASSVAAAFVRIQAGAEMGVQPFQAMSGIHLIQGKPVVGAALLAGLLDAHPAYSYLVEWTRDEAGAALACSVTIAKNGSTRGTATFSLADAERAGLIAKNPTWRTYPENMLFARALSNAVRWYAGGVTGGAPVYIDGEVEELEPIDLDELARKPSTEVLPRARISREERRRLDEERRRAGLTTVEMKRLMERVAGAANSQDLYADQVQAVLAEVEAAGVDEIGSLPGVDQAPDEPGEAES